MQFDERLKYLRNEKGLSEKELAEELETTETTIRLYEKGKLDVNLDMLDKAAAFFGVSTKLLLGTIFENLEPEDAVRSYRLVQELESSREKERAEAQAKVAAVQPEPAPVPVPPPVSAKPAEMTRHQFDTLYASRVAVYRTLSGINPAEWANLIEDYWPVNISITNIYGNDLNNYFYLRVNGDRMTPTLKNGDVMLVKKQSTLQNNEVGLVLCEWGEVIAARITHTVDKVVIYFDNQSYAAQIYEASQCKVLGKVLWKTNRPPR
ncbi:MAG: XRE family transcriptional regulator [Chitinophagales bacterium]